MTRGFLGRLALVATVAAIAAMAGCGRGWTKEQEQKFVKDCMISLQLADASKKQTICECWFDKASSAYSADAVKSPTREMGRVFIQWGKECSAEQGLTATIARPDQPPAAPAPNAPAAGEAPAAPGAPAAPEAPAAEAPTS